jgi:hypothetical protein
MARNLEARLNSNWPVLLLIFAGGGTYALDARRGRWPRSSRRLRR